jgi:imidazolonepropionase
MTKETSTLIGPFTQLVTMAQLPEKGPIADNALQIIDNGAIAVTDGLISAVGKFDELKHNYSNIQKIDSPAVALPGFIDCHTHICFAGSRAGDYALRLTGMSYQEIAKRGGGILDTVKKTRAASSKELIELTCQRAKRLMQLGITTCEVKSGYGLSVAEELSHLKVIQSAAKLSSISLIPTCLAAHTRPPEFNDNKQYLQILLSDLLPEVKAQSLSNRIDIFIDDCAFSIEEAREYLTAARQMGFDICIHADQFHRGGAVLAAELNAVSADHLEQSIPQDFTLLAKANVVAVALPGASLGLGIPQPAARQMLDNGACLAIASDWNPGSAPMGNLLTAAALLGASQKLTMAETLAGITFRAAKALKLNDRGSIVIGNRADLSLFPCSDYREILYQQGSMLPSQVYIGGKKCL